MRIITGLCNESVVRFAVNSSEGDAENTEGSTVYPSSQFAQITREYDVRFNKELLCRSLFHYLFEGLAVKTKYAQFLS